MKREIKFRAWDKRENKMLSDVEGFHVIGEVTMFGVVENHCQKTKGDGTTLERLTDIELMQFTGLKDKNGKEIYEGDIVRKESYSTGYCLPIVWRDCMFQLGHIGISPLYNETQFEVIGNIYENPELIQKQTAKLTP